MANYDAIIVGAGVSGLIAAKELESYNLKTLIIDQAPQVGGRLKTDFFEGFTLDQGFQVILSAYPMVKKHLDLKALECKAFDSGAFIFNGAKSFTVSDVKRNPAAAISMFFSPVGNIWDKLKMAKLRKWVLEQSVEEIFEIKAESTYDYLRGYGFSRKIIERFFRPFFSGIFLENDLETSNRQFLFVFKMFAEGEACLPKKGIASVAQQIKAGLRSTEFRLNAEVLKVEKGQVHLKNGSSLEAKQIIIACEPGALLPQLADSTEWNPTLQAYFEGTAGKLTKGLIALNSDSEGLISNVACLSKVQPAYAPKGKHLYSVSLKQDPGLSENQLEVKIQSELAPLLGTQASQWKLIRTYKVNRSLPRIDQVVYSRAFEESKVMDGIYLAGDHILNPSLNAAMLSGELAAKALILNHQAS